MKLKPMGDKIAIKQFEAEETTKSGIILTAKTKENPPIYEVIEIGDGKMADGTEVTMKVAVGQKVICNKYSGLSCTLNDEEITLLSQNDILAIYED